MSIDVAEAAPVDDRRCFACGPESDEGLRLVFRRVAGEGVIAETTLHERFQGWRGFAHGGIVMTLLDEAMAHACAADGESCVTAGVRVRFRKPTPLGEVLLLRGRVVSRRLRRRAVAASLHDASGRLLADAEGEFVLRGPYDVAEFDRRAAQIGKEK